MSPQRSRFLGHRLPRLGIGAWFAIARPTGAEKGRSLSEMPIADVVEQSPCDALVTNIWAGRESVACDR